MWQIGGFSLEICVILFYSDRAYPLNSLKYAFSLRLQFVFLLCLGLNLKSIRVKIE
jgi:hypothetical protein